MARKRGKKLSVAELKAVTAEPRRPNAEAQRRFRRSYNVMQAELIQLKHNVCRAVGMSQCVI